MSRASVTGGAAVLPGLAQYLARHAEPEARLARALGERYRAVLVVPAFREPPGMLAQYRAALTGAPGRVLVIVVVNAPPASAASSWPEHRELLEHLRGPTAQQVALAPPAWLASHDVCDVLSIDRAHPEHCLPERQGVGLARRIGCDVALGLYAAGRLEDPFLYCTDADAELPAEYFRATATLSEPPAALVFSFWHEPGGDPAIDAATAVYELGLRYHVDGLARARSPFAFHTIGSTLALRAPAYSAVRGFPRRLSGEDFYVLNKLAKVGAVQRVDGTSIRLRSRASLRTVHGTGVAAVKLAARAEGDAAAFYHPRIYALIGHWLDALSEYAQTREIERIRSRLQHLSGPGGGELCQVLGELGAWAALEQAARYCRGERALAVRLHTWFDAFRTLKLVHGLRARGFPSQPFRQALLGSGACTAEQARAASVDELRQYLAEREASAPPRLGLPLFERR